jgi:hypothetical protein
MPLPPVTNASLKSCAATPVRCLDGQPMLVQASTSSVRQQLEAWLVRHQVAPRIVGEFDDGLVVVRPQLDRLAEVTRRLVAALAERVDGHALDEVLEALVQGQDRSKDTVGYARALRAVTLARPELAPHLAPLRRDKRLREVLATPREAMEARWATTALAHLDEIPARAR